MGASVLSLLCITEANAAANYAEINRLTAYLVDHPDDSDSYAARAGYWAEAGAYDLALNDYQYAINLAPKTADYWASRATIYLTLGRDAQAAENCRIALKHDEGNLIAYRTQAQVRFKLGRYHEALASVNKGLLVDSSDVRLWRLRAHVHGKAGNNASAISDLEAAVANDPSDAQAWNDLGHFLRLDNRPTEALAAFNDAYKHDNESVEVNYNLGRVHLALGNADNAKRAFDRVLQPSPAWKQTLNDSYAKIATMHGDSAVQARNWSAAIGHFTNSDNLRSNVDVQQKLKQAYIEQLRHLLTHDGNDKQAELLFGEAGKKFPNDVPSISKSFAEAWTAWADAQAKVTAQDFEAKRDRLKKAWVYDRSAGNKKRFIEAVVRLMEVYASMQNKKKEAGLEYADALRYATGDKV
jgi:tetratricopeptide (TPR) repeat protein